MDIGLQGMHLSGLFIWPNKQVIAPTWAFSLRMFEFLEERYLQPC